MNEQTILNLLSAGKKLADNNELTIEESQAVSQFIQRVQGVIIPTPQELKNYLEAKTVVEHFQNQVKQENTLPIMIAVVRQYEKKYLIGA